MIQLHELLFTTEYYQSLQKWLTKKESQLPLLELEEESILLPLPELEESGWVSLSVLDY